MKQLDHLSLGKEESGRECRLLGCDEGFGGLRWKEEASVEHAGGCLPPGELLVPQ